MKAAINAFKQWGPALRGQVVALNADNKSMVAYLLKEGGTKSPALCQLARDLFTIVDKWGIVIRPAYLRGIGNVEADCLSRGQQVKEWCLRPALAHRVFRDVGYPQWDLFASGESSLAPSFFSITKEATSQGTDALLQDWSSLQGPLYAFPPPQLMPRVLSKVVVERVDLIIITPCWEDSGIYWSFSYLSCFMEFLTIFTFGY